MVKRTVIALLASAAISLAAPEQGGKGDKAGKGMTEKEIRDTLPRERKGKETDTRRVGQPNQSTRDKPAPGVSPVPTPPPKKK